MKLKRRNELSVTDLLPHQVALIWKYRDSYPYRFILTNAI